MISHKEITALSLKQEDTCFSSQHLLVDQQLLAQLLLLLQLQDAALLHHRPPRRVLRHPADGAQGILVGADGSHARQAQVPADLVPNLADLQRRQETPGANVTGSLSSKIKLLKTPSE